MVETAILQDLTTFAADWLKTACKAPESADTPLSLPPYSPLWRTANRPWFCFPCRSPEWTRAWWFPTATGGPSAPAVKSPGRAAARSPSPGGEDPGRRRRAQRTRSAVPSASASPLMLTPSTSTPGPCSLSLSPWWTWSTGWRTPCEEKAAGPCQWLPSRAVYKKLLESRHFNAGRLVQPKCTAGLSNKKYKKTRQSSDKKKCHGLWIWKYGN